MYLVLGICVYKIIIFGAFIVIIIRGNKKYMLFLNVFTKNEHGDTYLLQ